jgi:hypothetical protein
MFTARMPDRPQLTPERLAQLLDKLNEVMAEAERLRREVTRQLGEQREGLQPSATPPRPRKRRKATKRR